MFLVICMNIGQIPDWFQSALINAGLGFEAQAVRLRVWEKFYTEHSGRTENQIQRQAPFFISNIVKNGWFEQAKKEANIKPTKKIYTAPPVKLSPNAIFKIRMANFDFSFDKHEEIPTQTMTVPTTLAPHVERLIEMFHGGELDLEELTKLLER